MNKRTILLIAALTITVMISSLTPNTSGLPTTTTVLSSSGTITTPTVYSTINKGIYAYGVSFSDSDTTFITNHFNILNVDFGTQGVSNVKAKNPNIKVIGYKDLLAM